MSSEKSLLLQHFMQLDCKQLNNELCKQVGSDVVNTTEAAIVNALLTASYDPQASGSYICIPWENTQELGLAIRSTGTAMLYWLQAFSSGLKYIEIFSTTISPARLDPLARLQVGRYSSYDAEYYANDFKLLALRIIAHMWVNEQ